MTFCLPTKWRYIQTILFGTVLQEKVGTIYDHPTTQYDRVANVKNQPPNFKQLIPCA